MTVPRCAETTLAFFEILFQVVYREMVMNAVLKLENIWRHALMFCSVLFVAFIFSITLSQLIMFLGNLFSCASFYETPLRRYSEVCRYDWNKREIQPKAKDFMQLVWRGTRKVGIGRALTDLHGLPCAFIVALYRPGKINPLDIERNIGPGLFAPSYCNADGDESLLSTGYPSSFATRDSKSDQRAMYQENDNSPPSAKSLKGLQVAAEDNSGITFVPLSSFEKELDDQDAEGVLKEQPDIKSPNRFLPHISYVQTPDNFVAMDADDIGVKRDKGPLKEVKPYY